MFIDDQHLSSGSISVFIITKYNIDSVFSLYCITIYVSSCVTIYITISMYHGSTSVYPLHCHCREFNTLKKLTVVVQMKSNLQELLKYFEPVQKKRLSECVGQAFDV